MDSSFLFGISLTASFLAGVLALFAPCCITFLFPAYLGTIFKQNQKVMLYTLVFALGLSSILLPVAFGVRFVLFFFDAYHKQVYYLGSLILILMGVATLKPFFHLPQFFRFHQNLEKKATVGSVFALGVMSGLTSSCCAPVLFAAITLTTLSPSLLQAVIVSFAYVLGIVFPLFLLSVGYQKLSYMVAGKNRQRLYTVCKIIGAGVFIISGITIAVFNFFDKIQMGQMEGYNQFLRLFLFQIAKAVSNPLFDLAIFAAIVFLCYQLIKRFTKKTS